MKQLLDHQSRQVEDSEVESECNPLHHFAIDDYNRIETFRLQVDCERRGFLCFLVCFAKLWQEKGEM